MMSYGGKASHPTFRDDFALLDFFDYMSITSLGADKIIPRVSWLAMLTFIAGVAMLAWSHKFWGKQRSSPGSGRENAIRLSLFFLLASKYCIICITFWDTIFAVPSQFREDCLANRTRFLLGVYTVRRLSLHVVNWSLSGGCLLIAATAFQPGWQCEMQSGAHRTTCNPTRDESTYVVHQCPKSLDRLVVSVSTCAKNISHFGSTSQVPWKKATTLNSETT